MKSSCKQIHVWKTGPEAAAEQLVKFFAKASLKANFFLQSQLAKSYGKFYSKASVKTTKM